MIPHPKSLADRYRMLLLIGPPIGLRRGTPHRKRAGRNPNQVLWVRIVRALLTRRKKQVPRIVRHGSEFGVVVRPGSYRPGPFHRPVFPPILRNIQSPRIVEGIESSGRLPIRRNDIPIEVIGMMPTARIRTPGERSLSPRRAAVFGVIGNAVIRGNPQDIARMTDRNAASDFRR